MVATYKASIAMHSACSDLKMCSKASSPATAAGFALAADFAFADFAFAGFALAPFLLVVFAAVMAARYHAAPNRSETGR